MKQNKNKLLFSSKFKINIFEKKPINGGTPAIEKSDTVRNNRCGESKLKFEKEYRDLEVLIKLDVIIQNTKISVILYINMQENNRTLLV